MLLRLADPTPFVLMGGIISGILVAATVIVAVFGRVRPGPAVDEVRRKVGSWWVMAGLFFGAIALNPRISYLAIAFLCYLALKEYFTLIPTQMADRGALVWSYLIIPAHFYWIYTGWFGMFAIFVPVYVFLFIPFRQILTGETRDFVARCGRIIFGLMLYVYCLSHMGFLLTLPRGRELLLYLVFLTEMNDVWAFLAGKKCGRRKLAPAVSPNKTWEGAMGGLVGTVLGAWAFRFLTPFDPATALAVGAGISIAGVIGDLCTAAIKRDVGVKDASSFIPGHGGILDRVNSLTYSAPLFLHWVRYVYT